jgi:hypothetical protein
VSLSGVSEGAEHEQPGLRWKSMQNTKKEYAAPRLIVHGTIEDLTRQVKNKSFGGGDDVLVNNQAILSNVYQTLS